MHHIRFLVDAVVKRKSLGNKNGKVFPIVSGYSEGFMVVCSSNVYVCSYMAKWICSKLVGLALKNIYAYRVRTVWKSGRNWAMLRAVSHKSKYFCETLNSHPDVYIICMWIVDVDTKRINKMRCGVVVVCLYTRVYCKIECEIIKIHWNHDATQTHK